MLRRVRDLTVGVWGFGNIGRRTAEKFAALGCTVLFDDRHPERGFAGVSPVGVDELLARSDVLSIHLPASPATNSIVDAGVLASMLPGSLLVNTSRGVLVDLDALIVALDDGRPGAAALDVLAGEPAVPPRLAKRDDVILTPHVAFNSPTAVVELRRRATEDLVRVLRGEPAHDPVSL
jgi:D-3-phosphoglycerate dehydrogenase